MHGIQTYKTKDLVLKLNRSYNPINLDLSMWDRFLNVLCGDRLYQKEAIETAIIYLASGNYKSIEDLVKENWDNNLEIQNKYRSLEEYFNNIQLPNKL